MRTSARAWGACSESSAHDVCKYCAVDQGIVGHADKFVAGWETLGAVAQHIPVVSGLYSVCDSIVQVQQPQQL